MIAILKWMFVLILLLAIVGGGGAYWLYARSDEELRQLVLRQLKTMAPTMRFDIARVNCDIMGRVRIYELAAFLPEDDDDHPSLEVPEVLAALESTQLSDFDFVLQKLSLVKPKLRLSRNADGQWNLPPFVYQPTAGAPLPDMEIKNASILTEFQLPDQSVRRLIFKNFNLSSHPADSRRLAIQIGTELGPSGPLMMNIDAITDGSKWTCSSHQPWRVPVDSGLLQLICDLSPYVSDQMKQVNEWLDAAKVSQALAPMKLKSQIRENPSVEEFGVKCVCDLTFLISKDGPTRPLAYQVKADVSKGHVNNEILPFPLHEVEGTVYVENRQISIENLRAQTGTTRMIFNGDVVPSKPITASVKLRDVDLNENLTSRLPDGIRRILQSMDLTGTCNIDASVTQDQGKWLPKVDLWVTKGTVTHERFPVTVRDVTGELHLDHNVADFDAQGVYAGQVVKAHGQVTNPGKEHGADIVIASQNLPLDDESIAACGAHAPAVKQAIQALRLQGRHDFLLRITRRPGLNQKYEPELNEHLYGGSMLFNHFRYGIQNLEGYAKWKGDVVEFTKLAGTHDTTTLTGSGTFHRGPGKGRLELSINAKEAEFDRSLEIALPKTLQQVWAEFQPKGVFDADTEIDWVPGTPCVIRMPNVVIRKAEATMRSFPWTLQNLTGELSYNVDPGVLVIKSLKAEHDDTPLTADGTTLITAEGTGSFQNGQPWQLEFSRLNIDNLIPNATFRNALPEKLRKVWDQLRPTGVFSLEGPVVFNGPPSPGQSISSAWKLKTVLSRCGLTTGTRVEEINGIIEVSGAWNGFDTMIEGALNLDTIRLFRHPVSGQAYEITRVTGPFAFRDNRFVAGSEAAIPPRKTDVHDPEKRIRGKVIGGTIFLDAVANSTADDEPEYRFFVELQNGKLEQYAQQYLRGQSKLAGIMNGYINLRGKGTTADRLVGGGKLVIAPAAIIELPFFVQIFNMLQFKADRAAFEQVEANFDVADERFTFSSIEMQGDSFRMGGYGFVRFNGAMELKFGLSRKQLIPNPFSELATVHVTGNVGNPQTKFGPIEFDESMKKFFSFDPRRMTPRNNLFSPRASQNSDAVNR